MLHWLLRTLVGRLPQLLTSAGGVAFALLLVLLFEAVFAGESDQIVAYPDNVAADVWVMQRGVSNMHMAISLVKDWKIAAVAKIEGVTAVTPILYMNTVVIAGDREWFSFVVGLPPDGARAGPWAISHGASHPGSGETVVPALLAEMSGIGLQDEITIADKTFAVVGLSDGTYSMANSVIFVTERDLADILSSSDLISYLLVDVADSAEPEAVAERIRRQVPDVSVLLAADFVANDYAVAMQMGLEMISLMTVIGGALVLVVVAFSVYGQISRQSRELAIARAIGVRPLPLIAAALMMALFIGAIGVLLAILLACLTVPLTAALVPQLTLHITLASLIRVGLVVLVAAVIAALLSIRRLLKIDPIIALKG